MTDQECNLTVEAALQSVAKRIDRYVSAYRAKSAERQRQEQQRRTFAKHDPRTCDFDGVPVNGER